MDKNYKVAIIGCGGRGDKHALGFDADNRCKVTALVDIKREAAEKINKKYNFKANIYQDYREMLVREKVDIVAICLWTDLHLPVFMDCAQTGIKAALVEKPMAITWENSKKYRQIVEKTGCQLTFGHQRRFAEGNQLARKWIKQGKFGEITRMDMFSPHHILDCGTHTIDQALSFNQEKDVKWVLGAIDTRKIISIYDVKAETGAAGTMVFENDVNANIQLGLPDQEMWGGVRVEGTRGFIEVFWDGNYGKGKVYDDPQWEPPEVNTDDEIQMKKMISNAVDSLNNGKEPELSYKKALRAAEIIFAFYESVYRHKLIKLPLTEGIKNPFYTMLEQGQISYDEMDKMP